MKKVSKYQKKLNQLNNKRKINNQIYQMSIDKVYDYFSLSNQGLSSDKVIINRNKYGPNKIRDARRKTVFEVFLEQYLNVLVIVLILASVFSYFTGGLENTIVIIIVITLNAILGTIEYFKAEKSLQSLKKMTSLSCKVLRNNEKIIINSDEMVSGDICEVKAGDIVPADLRIISSTNLEVDESMLTGESIECEKNNEIIDHEVNISERKNILYRGTKIVSGKGLGICYAVGMNTEIGHIAHMMQSVKRKKSPLEKSIDKFSKELALIILVICLLVFILSIYQNISKVDALMFAISLAVAAIPEALQTIVTIVLAISTEKLAKEKAIVKDIKAIETLGSVDIICTDKTGTLTQNKMMVDGFYLNNHYQEKVKYNVNNSLSIENLFVKGIILCNDSDINNLNTNSINTDEAIIRYCLKENNEFVNKFIEEHERVYEIPFTSKNKYSVSVNRINNNSIMYIKGGSEKVLSFCNLSQSEKSKITKVIDEYSSNGYRIITIGYKKTNNKQDITLENINFLGLIFLVDPVKEGVIEAIEKCKKYNTKVVMITGDHQLTALSIAKKIGIENNKYLLGSDLSKMSEKEILNSLDDISIFARVSPSDKIKIVELFQKKGHKVAFIGDGVNDAPALKKADVGVAMGVCGTDVSKEASDLILMDDNLETINKAIGRERKVYQNIQNAILFLIAGNIAGIFIVLYTTLLKLPMPFAPVHLLFINLINDSLPAIAIGIEENGVSTREIFYPRSNDSSLLSKRVSKRIIMEGLLIAICTIISYYIGLDDIYKARTMVFVTITVARLFYSFNCRGRFSLLYQKKKGYKFNLTLLIALIFGLVMVNLLLFVPYFYKLFAISELSFKEIVYAYGLGLIPALMIQAFLMYRDKKRFKKNK